MVGCGGVHDIYVVNAQVGRIIDVTTTLLLHLVCHKDLVVSTIVIYKLSMQYTNST